MLEIYTIYGGGMWKTALDAVVTLVGQNTFHTLMRIAGTFGVLAVLLTFIKQRNPMLFVQWLAVFMILTSILLIPKRSVQVIDLSDPGTVWVTDNVPVGLAAIASLTTSIGYKMASVYDMLMARPDSVTYSKTGMLFGSQIVAETSDFTTQNPELAQMLPDYVENCVIGDILLNGKYTINQLLNSTDPLTLITSNPSPLRGIFKMTSTSRQFLTCQQAATEIQKLANTDVNPGSATFTWLTRKVFGNKLNGASLLANSMGDSYGFFYAGGMTAAQIMKNNITNSAVRQGIKGFAARSSDTANLLNLATENAATKQRLAWAAGNELATRTLPFAQSLLMLILVCLFPLMIALAASNHTLFGLNTLKIYVSGFIYFQMWPVMFAILNYAANYWLQSQSGGTPLVLANKDVVALQHSDVANLAGYLSLSIPVLSFYLTKGAAAMGSQVAGSVLSSGAFTSAGVAATTADGNWSFNNMSMDNVSQNKMDTNLMQRQGQQTWQADNGSTQTQTAGGHTVIDGSGAMSNLPVNMKLSQLASSGFQESARQSQVQAQTALDGYNHSVTSGWSQLSQLSNQTGTSDSLIKGSENSQATNATRGAGMMLSAAESYAKANNISTQEAYNKLMDISNQGSVSAGVKGTAGAGVNLGVVKIGAEGSVSGDLRHSTGSSRGVQDSGSQTQDSRHDQNSQAVNDFRQGMDMVKSSRITDGANHSENAASSNVQQLNKYGDKAQSMLTSAPSAREAAMEFVNERLKPEIMGDYQQGRSDLTSGQEHAAFSGEHIVQPARGSQQVSGSSGHDAGVSYSAQYGGARSSGSVSSTQPYETTQGAEYGGQQGENYSARTDDSVSPGIEHSTVHQGQAAGQRSSSGNITSSAGMIDAGGRTTADERTGHIAESHPEFHHSGAIREKGNTYGQESEITHSRSGINVGGEKVRGDAMQESFKENQAKLHEHSTQGFGPQNELQRRVAEQRSENEHKINESAGEIDKKQSTVQASSDILKGENLNATGNFKIQRKEAEIDQQTPVIDSAEKRKLEEQLLELRKRAG
ncbi:MAG: conjugal transfer mating-pair stabilization protein TraG [Enterobacter roggenkampii]|nr:conjugal transfer mating-pair stabilization protein TraG [Enterobacter roggenkampii]